MNKKAQTPEDLIYMVVFFLAFGLMALVGSYAYSQIKDAAMDVEMMNSSSIVVASLDAGTTVSNLTDYVFLFIFIGFGIAIWIIAYFIPSQPIIITLYVIAMVIGGLISSIMQYVWEQISQSTNFIAITNNNMLLTNHVLTNLVLYYVIIGAIGMIILFGKQSKTQEQML